jgi:periplasmic divalent cation tolerance protein
MAVTRPPVQPIPGTNVVQLARAEADGLGHPFVGPEHLLLGLAAAAGPAARLLATSGATLEAMRRSASKLSTPDAGAAPETEGDMVPATMRAMRAAEHGTGPHDMRLLLAILRGGDQRAEKILAGITDPRQLASVVAGILDQSQPATQPAQLPQGVIVYVTAKTDEAGTIARALVEERLAACVNLIDVQSVYRWEGKVAEDGETLLVIKTSDHRIGQLTARVKELHSYALPEIMVLPVTGGLQEYLSWIADVTSEITAE